MPYFVDTSKPQGRYPQDQILCHHKQALLVFCSSNVSIDEGMFGFSIGASEICLKEYTESNGPVCDDTISGLGGSGLVVLRCLQNMALYERFLNCYTFLSE
jgi:hypothetical protein